MFCRNCGTQIRDTAIFCKECGMKTQAETAQSEQTAPPIQEVAQPTQSAQATRESTENLKALIAEREYVFRGNAYSRSLILSIIGSKVTFKLAKEELAIQFEGKKGTTIPYADLKSFHFENKTRISLIIGGIFYALLGLFFVWMAILGALNAEEGGMLIACAVVAVVAFVAAAVMIFYFSAGEDFIVETRSGQSYKAKVRRIREKKQAEKDAFLRDLNIMLQ